ncbi:CpsD/CapB family tyrosine-protein kinase [Virgibacillus sp. C22-A2]|uniref:non-specific protein-tyrosine kinase n=1 Tax=Virgibacillus tibetensis TaxID=3042313 RepID=A0ABU6KFD5_9BACI|nr:CpsD/CapB family tyrosine-protein kinase [Virgibacillus sp. C22-A2]
MLNKRSKADSVKKRHLITHSSADSIISDQFRTIRTNIKFLSEEKRKRTFLVTSPGIGEGKSTTTANLAVSVAQQKDKVLLVDTNLREPIIHRIFKISNEVGLTDILTEKATFDEAIHKTGIGKLDILTSGSAVSSPAEVLGNEIMAKLLNGVKTAYDMVLIDSPTILKSTETRLLANQCDGVILVVNRGKTILEKAVEARKILKLSRSDLVGVIINEKG